jgi:ribose transport system substrate-binding protein
LWSNKTKEKREMKNILLAGLICVALVGCGGSGVEPDQPGENAGSETTETLRIAVIPKSLSHEFWMTVKAGAEAAGKEAGAEIIWIGTATETEVAGQMNIVQDMINSKVDALVMAAIDAEALIPKVELAKRSGIPVITIDSGVNSDVPLSFVATDNIAGAVAAADALAELIGGEGPVGLIPFVAGAATSELREQGFKEGLKKHPKVTLADISYCQSDVAKAMDVTQDMLTSNPDLKGIFAANEPGAVGAAQALKASGRAGDVKLVAFDAAPSELEALKDGTIQALIVQSPFNMGYLGVKAALDAIEGKAVEKRIDTGVSVVTLENIDTPEIQKLLNPLG